MSATYITGYAGGRKVGRVKGKGKWVNDASRHSQPSCVHSGPDRWPQQP